MTPGSLTRLGERIGTMKGHKISVYLSLIVRRRSGKPFGIELWRTYTHSSLHIRQRRGLLRAA